MRRFCFVLAVLLLLLSSCYVFKAYRFRNFDLEDLPKFDAAPLPSSDKPFSFAYDTLRHLALKQSLDSQLLHSQSYAFIVIRNDSILYERYFGNVTPDAKLPSFSAAKSVTSTLLAIALSEGKIRSLQDPITTYLPELRKRDKRFDNVTLQHVLDMRSGIKSNESYTNPFSSVLKMGFARNASKPALKATTEKAPGEFDYKSANTQLLALVVERVTGRKLYEYAAEKLWAPLQMEFAANWNVDKHQTVRAFCCLNAAARDYAKFGRLFLHRGAWQGRQLVPEDWVQRTTAADTMLAYNGYKNQWWAEAQRHDFTDSAKAAQWLAASGAKGTITVRPATGGSSIYRVRSYDGSFYAAGLLGQYVYVNPKNKVVIVRLGHNWSHPSMYATRFIHQLGQSL